MEVEKLLLPNSPIKITSGIDRYGFSSVLANKCAIPFVPRSFANWTHGWIWYDDPNAEDLMMSHLPRDIMIVVRNEIELIALKSWGFTDVRLGGLPFAYVDQQHAFRNKNSLLVFPVHSDETSSITGNIKEYFDYLETLKKDFESIYISVYYLDIGGPMHKAAIDLGFRVLQGARPDDANSMLRMRAILDAFKYVSTNNMGSHVLYALYAGCKVSFSGPMYQIEESIISKIATQSGYHDDYVDRASWYLSETYLRQKFSKFFVENPRQGAADVHYATEEIGAKYILSPSEIKDAMGWTVGGQINGYVKGAARRVIRNLR